MQPALREAGSGRARAILQLSSHEPEFEIVGIRKTSCFIRYRLSIDRSLTEDLRLEFWLPYDTLDR